MSQSGFSTPQKRRSETAMNSPPAKSWKSPKQRDLGKPEDINGFLLFVGQMALSQNNNQYFDIIIQRAKSVISTIRIMDGLQKRALFVGQQCSQDTMLSLCSVYRSNDIYFFNPINGSSLSFTPTTLSFPYSSFASFTTKLQDVPTSVASQIHVYCQLKFLGAKKQAPGGSWFRNAVIYDSSSDIFLTVWNHTLFDIVEEKDLYITELKIKEYFGLQLATQSNSNIMYCETSVLEPLPAVKLASYRARAQGTITPSEIVVPGIVGATFTSSISCPSEKCRTGQIIPPEQGNIGKCNECSSGRVNMKLAKYSITGEIKIDDDVLYINEEGIDAVFGDGVAKIYSKKPDDLADKFLEMEDLKIVYDSKSKNIVYVEVMVKEVMEQS